MWVDPIVEEIHREREAYAAEFNHDLEAIFQDIKRQERASGREYVTPPPKPSAPQNGIIVQARDGAVRLKQ